MPNFDRGDNLPEKQPPQNMVPQKSALEIYEPRCKVCKSQYRRAIDRLMTVGVSYAELARQFEEEGITRRGLAVHKERHMSVTDKAVREIIEEQIRAMGEDVENTKQHILTRQGALDVGIMQGYTGIVTGDIPIEARDWIQMINLREKMAEKTAAIQMEETMREMNAFMQAVKAIVPEDMWLDVNAKFEYFLQQDSRIIDSYGIEVTYGKDVALPSLEKPIDVDIEDE
jgi:hypothetical protein